VLGVIVVISYIFAEPGLAARLNSMLDMKDTSYKGSTSKSQSLNWIFVPNAILAGEKPRFLVCV
jgi:hypothetical protein